MTPYHAPGCTEEEAVVCCGALLVFNGWLACAAALALPLHNGVKVQVPCDVEVGEVVGHPIRIFGEEWQGTWLHPGRRSLFDGRKGLHQAHPQDVGDLGVAWSLDVFFALVNVWYVHRARVPRDILLGVVGAQPFASFDHARDVVDLVAKAVLFEK